MDFVGSNTIGTLDSAPDGSIITHIFGYVSSVLSRLEADTNENENAITHKLCLLLGQQKPPEYPYFFQHQNLEDKTANTSTDFAAYGTLAYHNTLNAFALVIFEAKRLSVNLPHKREREYVFGEYIQERQVHNSGGIERFKNERHGKRVAVAGLIGYVQTNDNPFWFQKINEWIQDEIERSHNPLLTWTFNDKLSLVKSENRLSQYISKSIRLSGDAIELRHLWVNLTQKT